MAHMASMISARACAMNGRQQQSSWKNSMASTTSLHVSNPFSEFGDIKLQGKNVSQGSTARSTKTCAFYLGPGCTTLHSIPPSR